MTADEIQELARTKKPLPDGLTLSEQNLYLTLRQIYYLYDVKELTVAEAQRKKSDAIRRFNSDELSERVFLEGARRHFEILQLFHDAPKDNSCPICKKAFYIFSGIIRTASDCPVSEYEESGESNE